MVLGQILILLSGLRSGLGMFLCCLPSEASLSAFPKLCEGRTGMFHCSMQEHLWCSVLLSLGFPDDTFIGVSSCKSHGYVKQKGE